MNIKSLLIGSAAALAAVSGAQAADAIVAAEPEPMEYVRVCDAFGTGFFYIPGTETCLKIGGFVRFQTGFGRDDFAGLGSDGFMRIVAGERSDWDTFMRAQVTFDARNDTELGTLRSFIALRGHSGGDEQIRSNFEIEEAYIELNGFKIGHFWSWWDNGIAGETDTLGNDTRFNSIAYIYDGGAWRAGVSLDELDDSDFERDAGKHHALGLAGTVGFSLGGVGLDILGGYDFGAEEGAIRGIVSADLGPGSLQVAGIWASGASDYWAASEWTIAAAYSFKATEKLTITPALQYFDDLGFVNGTNMWRAGLTVGYQVVEGLNLLTTVDYNDADLNGAGDTDFVRGFVRLQRNF